MGRMDAQERDRKVGQKRKGHGRGLRLWYFLAGIGLLLVVVACLLLANNPAPLERQVAVAPPRPTRTPLPKADGPTQAQETPDMHVDMAALHRQNSDVVGWVRIEGTAIDYPVLYTEGQDYYLYRNFEQEEDRKGSIYIDKYCTVEPR
ncbi:MAG: hypothetical protein ACOYI4_09835, partial [Christensenellales bacterium]